MALPSPYKEELLAFRRFEQEELLPSEARILELLAHQGLSHKDVAQRIHRSPKTVERVVTVIGRKYCAHFGLKHEAPFHQIKPRAACYYYLKDLLNA